MNGGLRHQPHAVTSAGSASYAYDANGNNVTGDGRVLHYTSFDKPYEITKGGHSTTFAYGPERTRYRRIDYGANGTTTTRYIGSVEIKRENSEAFKISRRKHSAVESGINALEVHGLDRCLDHGLNGFKRYAALAVVARNVQKLGAELQKKLRKREKRKRHRDKLVA